MGSPSLLFQTAFFRHCLQPPTSGRSPPQGSVPSAPTRPGPSVQHCSGTGRPVCKEGEEGRSGAELRAAAAGCAQRSRSSCSSWFGVPLCSPMRSVRSALLDDEQQPRLSSRQQSSDRQSSGSCFAPAAVWVQVIPELHQQVAEPGCSAPWWLC